MKKTGLVVAAAAVAACAPVAGAVSLKPQRPQKSESEKQQEAEKKLRREGWKIKKFSHLHYLALKSMCKQRNPDDLCKKKLGFFIWRQKQQKFERHSKKEDRTEFWTVVSEVNKRKVLLYKEKYLHKLEETDAYFEALKQLHLKMGIHLTGAGEVEPGNLDRKHKDFEAHKEELLDETKAAQLKYFRMGTAMQNLGLKALALGHGAKLGEKLQNMTKGFTKKLINTKMSLEKLKDFHDEGVKVMQAIHSEDSRYSNLKKPAPSQLKHIDQDLQFLLHHFHGDLLKDSDLKVINLLKSIGMVLLGTESDAFQQRFHDLLKQITERHDEQEREIKKMEARDPIWDPEDHRMHYKHVGTMQEPILAAIKMIRGLSGQKFSPQQVAIVEERMAKIWRYVLPKPLKMI